MSVLHHSAVMMNRRPTKQRRVGERGGEEKRSCSAFLSLYFIMEITSFTLGTSPFISYCHRQNPFSMCTSVCVCVSACCQENRGKAGSSLFVTPTVRAAFSISPCSNKCKSLVLPHRKMFQLHLCVFILTFWSTSFPQISFIDSPIFQGRKHISTGTKYDLY